MAAAKFNASLKRFLEELSAVFPEENALKMCVATFDGVIAVDPNAPRKAFMDLANPHADLIKAHSDELFSKPLDVGGVDISKLWAREDLSDTNREAIWSYISSLYMLGSMIQGMPSAMLDTIGTLMESMESGSINPSDIIGRVLGAMGPPGSVAPLAAMFAGLTGDTSSAHTAKKKKAKKSKHRTSDRT